MAVNKLYKVYGLQACEDRLDLNRNHCHLAVSRSIYKYSQYHNRPAITVSLHHIYLINLMARAQLALKL